MVKDVDFSKLKDEISARKSQKQEDLNESSDGGGIPKDQFLHNLQESLKTGRPNQATNRLKKIDEVADNKDPKQANLSVSQNKTPYNEGTQSNSNAGVYDSIAKTQGKIPQSNAYDSERDNLLYEEFERKQKEMLSGGAKKYYEQQQNNQTESRNGESNGTIISESKIIETVNEAITNKFGVVVEQAMKDQIFEVYSKARMRETIEENKTYIKEIVKEVIRELQTKNRKKE